MEKSQEQWDIKGLVEFALKAKIEERADDIPDTPEYKAMDEDRREFLDVLMDIMRTTEMLEEFKVDYANVEDPTSTEEAALVVSLSNISDHLGRRDLSAIFFKLGGAPTLYKHLKSESLKVRAACMCSIFDIGLNNPIGQAALFNLDILPTLMENLKEEDEDCGVEAITAIQTIVWHYDPALLAFVQLNGQQALVDCLNSKISDKFNRAVFLIAITADQIESVKDAYVALDVVDKLEKHIEVEVDGENQRMRNILHCMSILCRSEKWLPDEKYKEELAKKLNTFIALQKDKRKCFDMVDNCKTIKVCFDHSIPYYTTLE